MASTNVKFTCGDYKRIGYRDNAAYQKLIVEHGGTISAGYDYTFLGLRSQESKARDRHLAKSGSTYRRRFGMVCCPIFDWHHEAVFHLIAAAGAPLNRVYAKLANIDIEPEHQRVGPLPITPRTFLERGWPELLVRLGARYPGRW